MIEEEIDKLNLNPITEDTKDDISKNIDVWINDYIGSEFKFREHQKETIIEIIYNILNDKAHTQLIEAPTGSGKSLLNIISAGVLSTCYKKSSYILVSDLFLWKQYDDFIRQHPNIRKEFGILKGQTGNYNCLLNNLDVRNADCRMAGVSWGNLFDPVSAQNLGYGCAATCKYVKERRKALKSNVVIMTYQLYHYMLNVVYKQSSGKAKFCPRDTIFCDECHNIPTIVSNNFTPEIKPEDKEVFKTIYEYGMPNAQLDLFDDFLAEAKGEDELNKKQIAQNRIVDFTWKEASKVFDDCWNVFIDPHASYKKDNEAIQGYINLINMLGPICSSIEADLQYKKQHEHKEFDEDDRRRYRACSYLRNCACFWNDFGTCIEETGPQYVIKKIEENRNTKQTVVKFSDVKEDFLCWYFLLSTSEHQVLMSATIGGYEAYYENTGLSYSEKRWPETDIWYKVIPSTFDFSNSPVYFINRHKMSYAYKEQSFKVIKPMVYKLCEQTFYGKKGMIQTGSYANAKELYDDAPYHIKKRMLIYDNSRDKSDKITLHQMSEDTILVGPTLVEGIDLPGDDCRFIIIIKVPYPVIIDRYVKEKMNIFPKWYNSTTSNIIIQGIGRGNRFRDDWCKTYIFDACFLSLYNATKSQYAPELQKRIRIIN
ncbi:MAG: DEAD/DEAH box helicase family protein [Clostridia bacterium]|nr:DEAD/DEAH box helicase family protein [Clostridia bacterium]